jgi:hypothetical protein
MGFLIPSPTLDLKILTGLRMYVAGDKAIAGKELSMVQMVLVFLNGFERVIEII